MLDVALITVETADEVEVLLNLTAPAGGDVAKAVSLVIRPADAVPAFALWNDLPVRGVDDGVMVELGDFNAGDHRQLLLRFEVPGMPQMSVTRICELELRWLDQGVDDRDRRERSMTTTWITSSRRTRAGSRRGREA